MKPRRSIALIASGAVAGALVTAAVFLLFMHLSTRPDAASEDASTDVAETETEPPPEPEREPPVFKRDIKGDCVFFGVVQTASGKPVAGARVGVWLLDQPWSAPQPPAEIQSDALGAFRLPGIDAHLPVLLYVLHDAQIAPSLEKPACGASLTLLLEPGDTLTVTVTDGGDSPLKDAETIIAGEQIWPPRVGYTDASGRLPISGMPDGEYVVWATKGNKSAIIRHYLSDTRTSRAVTLKAADVSPIIFRAVDDAQKQPIPNLGVLVSPVGFPLLERVMVTDAAGVVSIRCPVEDGCTFVPDRQLFEDTGAVTLLPGVEKTVPLKYGATVEGVVRDQQGAPVVGATLVVSENMGSSAVAIEYGSGTAFSTRLMHSASGGWPLLMEHQETFLGPSHLPVPNAFCDDCGFPKINASSSAVTAADGRFVLHGLPSRLLTLSAEHPEMVMMNEPVPVDLTSLRHIKEITLVMRPGSKAVVRTVDERGIPITGASVAVYDDANVQLRESLTDNDGYADFVGLPDYFRIEATHEAYIAAVSKIDVRTGSAVDITMTLTPADKVLSGRVKDKNGFGIPGATVIAKSIERGHPHVLTGTTSEDGSFSLPKAGAGRYSIRADAGERGRANVASTDYREETKLVLGSGAPAEAPSGEDAYTVIEPERQPRDADLKNTPVPSSDIHGVPAGDLNADNLGITGDVPGPLPQTNTLSSSYGSADPLPVTAPPSGKGGLPIKIGSKGGYAVVTSVAEGSRVAIAGLVTGSRILSVDGKPVNGPVAAKKAILGPIGTVVMLEVQEPDSDESYTIVVQRVPAR